MKKVFLIGWTFVLEVFCIILNLQPISVRAVDINLVPNNSFETVSSNLPTSWNKGGYGTNTAKFSLLTTGAEDGKKAVKVSITKYTSGDAKWYFDDVPVKPNTEYIFSDYYKSSVATEIVIRYTSTSDKISYIDLLNPKATTSWTKTTSTFTTPSNVKSLTIFHLIAKKGNLSVDNYSLTELLPIIPTPTTTATAMPISTATPIITATEIPTITPIAKPTPTLFPTPTPTPTPLLNLIENGSVETANGNNPVNWARGGWGTNTRIFTYPAEASDGSKGIRVELTSRINGDAKWYFNEIPITPGDTYSFSDDYKSNITSYLTVQFHNTDGSYSYADVANLPASTNWQTATALINVPTEASAMTIFHLILSVGWLETDNFKLVTGILPNPKLFSQGMVSFNFDDGYLSTYQNAVPVLNAAGIKGTFYIIGETLDGSFSGYVNASQVLAMQTAGHEIGNHTVTHPHLTMLTDAQIQSEIQGAQNALFSIGVSKPSSIAYPYGEYNSSVIQISKNAGLSAGRTASWRGENYKDTDKFQLLTVDIEVTTAVSDVESWIDSALADKSWVILMFHRIDDSGNQHSFIPANFQQVVNYVKTKNVTTVTNAQGVQMMFPQ